MNCDDVGRILSETSASARLPEQVTEHLKECPRCLNAARALDSSALQDLPTPDQLHKIEEALLADLRPVRPLARPIYWFAALIAIFVAAVEASIWRLGTAGLSAMTGPQAAAILSVLTVSALLLAYFLPQHMTPGRIYGTAPRLLPIVILCLLVFLIALLFPLRREPDFWSAAWGCIRPGAIIAALTAVPLRLILRRGAILSPAWAGLSAGLFAGLAATAALEARCPILNAWHILAAHVGVAGLSATLGLLFGLWRDRSSPTRK
jgi:Negative regulator of sigma F